MLESGNCNFGKKENVPRKFVVRLRGALPETVELKDPSEGRWRVSLKKTDCTTFLEEGWEEFARAQSLEAGDFLVFRFNGVSRFKVLVFGPSGCEKCSPAAGESFPPGARERETPTGACSVSVPKMAVGLDEPEDSPQECGKLRRCFSGGDGRRWRWRRWGKRGETETIAEEEELADDDTTRKKTCSSYPLHLISQRGPVSAGDRERTMRLAATVKPVHPSFLCVIKRSHISRKPFLTVPWRFAAEFFPGKETECLGCRSYGKLSHFQRGWRSFVVGNHLDIGDILVFEFAASRSNQHMNVTIFRADELLPPPSSGPT
ncbi:unnamed protein product [Spirodela intermedia]|uniref:TF-B3 domain-containing protein n=1 Tax=Spirodela intermedia TaxID=51605 RepID=A0A7I8JIJ2_SPIIN|nr:unnamed protein product [Spirodela intermedia]CAA6669988.1 unnamed protein product [Spirodela intermedia]